MGRQRHGHEVKVDQQAATSAANAIDQDGARTHNLDLALARKKHSSKAEETAEKLALKDVDDEDADDEDADEETKSDAVEAAEETSAGDEEKKLGSGEETKKLDTKEE